MSFLKSSLCATAVALTFALPAQAGNTGLAVTGTLAFGANGANGGQYWPTQAAVIGSGIEYSYTDASNKDTADFSDTQLTIRDQVLSSANGWEMTFKTPDSFSSLSLVSSSFFPGLNFSLAAGKIVVDWLGTGTGPHDYVAVFNVGIAPAVPEPETYALMLAGLGIVGFVARRRRA